MKVENIDALKAWLSVDLKSRCEADPETLTKYVLALIKKDKPVEELKDTMPSQMEVFLQAETKAFVELLFKQLESKDYIKDFSDIENSKDAKGNSGVADSTTPKTGDSIKDPVYKPSKKPTEEDARILRRRSPLRYREDSPPQRYHRRSPGLGGRRYRSRSRSPVFRRLGSPNGRRHRLSFRRSRSRSFSPPKKFLASPSKDEDVSGYNPTPTSRKPRCRDYDEKGFCLLGDQCKYEHGTDALVLEDAKSAGIAYPTGIPPPALFPEPYVPAPAAVIPLPPFHLPPPGYSPDAIVPALTRKRPFSERLGDQVVPPTKRFEYNRGGQRGRGGFRGRGHGRSGPQAPTSNVAIRNIPQGLNSIAHLNNHFAKYGTLVNVQVHFEGDPSSALVTFSSPTEAEAAVNSPEAVLGMRFIRIFLHTEKPANAAFPVPKPSGKTDKNSDENEPSEKAADSEDSTKAANSKTREKALELQAIKNNQKFLETRVKNQKENEQKMMETREKMVSLRKAKQDLLDKLLEEQKGLLFKLESKKSTLKPEEKSAIMSLLKSLSKPIEDAREDLKKLCLSAGKRTQEEVQKDLLDAELELFTAEQNGEETEELAQRVQRLKVEGAKYGILPTSRAPRGHGLPFTPRGGGARFPRIRGRGRGRFISPKSTSVDRRPSKVLVSGVTLDEKDAIVEHFMKFGEIIETSDDETEMGLVINFKTRRIAEIAMVGGKMFGERALQLSWYTGVSQCDLTPKEEPTEVPEIEDDYTPLDPTYLPPGLEEEKPNKFVSEKEAESLEEEFGNEELVRDLLQEYEEEETSGEDRSWKH